MLPFFPFVSIRRHTWAHYFSIYVHIYCSFPFLFSSFYYMLLFICMCMCVRVYILAHKCQGTQWRLWDNLWNSFSPSTMCTSGIVFRSSGFGGKCLFLMSHFTRPVCFWDTVCVSQIGLKLKILLNSLSFSRRFWSPGNIGLCHSALCDGM